MMMQNFQLSSLEICFMKLTVKVWVSAMAVLIIGSA